MNPTTHPCNWKPETEIETEPVEEVELQAFPMMENFLALNAKNVLEIDAIFYHTWGGTLEILNFFVIIVAKASLPNLNWNRIKENTQVFTIFEFYF